MSHVLEPWRNTLCILIPSELQVTLVTQFFIFIWKVVLVAQSTGCGLKSLWIFLGFIIAIYYEYMLVDAFKINIPFKHSRQFEFFLGRELAQSSQSPVAEAKNPDIFLLNWNFTSSTTSALLQVFLNVRRLVSFALVLDSFHFRRQVGRVPVEAMNSK